VHLTFNKAKSVIAVPFIDVLGYRVLATRLLNPILSEHTLCLNFHCHIPQKSWNASGTLACYEPWIMNFSEKLKPLKPEQSTFLCGMKPQMLLKIIAPNSLCLFACINYYEPLNYWMGHV